MTHKVNMSLVATYHGLPVRRVISKIGFGLKSNKVQANPAYLIKLENKLKDGITLGTLNKCMPKPDIAPCLRIMRIDVFLVGETVL